MKRFPTTIYRRRGRAMTWLMGLLCCLASHAGAQGVGDVKSYTRATFDEWLAKYRDAKPAFKPGDDLTSKDLEPLRPFVPPGYIEYLSFPEFKAEIIDHVDHRPSKAYVECTERQQSQVRLKENGALDNYVCGEPFALSSLKVDDPTAGIKVAWNFNFRWQNFGLGITTVGWIWDRFGGTHQAPRHTMAPGQFGSAIGPIPADYSDIYKGGGTFQRALEGPYRRVYFSHLAGLDKPGGVLPVEGAADFEFKEFTGFHGPFDIRGTAFIIYRYSDPLRADDSWAYIPNLRRVRRISIETKSDSLLGTDHTLEDFYSFSGRVLDWNWKFLGWKELLSVMDSRWDDSHFYGPNGIIPDDVWSLRRFAVVERTPKNPRHPYSSVVMFLDVENWDAWLSIAWDKKGKLWKVFEWQKKWSENYQDPGMQKVNAGKRITTFQSVQVLDVQNDRGTLVPCYGRGYVDIESAAEVNQLYDISRLEELHR